MFFPLKGEYLLIDSNKLSWFTHTVDGSMYTVHCTLLVIQTTSAGLLCYIYSLLYSLLYKQPQLFYCATTSAGLLCYIAKQPQLVYCAVL